MTDADRQAVLDVLRGMPQPYCCVSHQAKALLDALIAMPDKGPLLRALGMGRERTVSE